MAESEEFETRSLEITPTNGKRRQCRPQKTIKQAKRGGPTMK